MILPDWVLILREFGSFGVCIIGGLILVFRLVLQNEKITEALLHVITDMGDDLRDLKNQHDPEAPSTHPKVGGDP